MLREERAATVDTWWLFTIAEEVGVGASSVLVPDVAALHDQAGLGGAEWCVQHNDDNRTLEIIMLCGF